MNILEAFVSWRKILFSRATTGEERVLSVLSVHFGGGIAGS